MNLQSGALFLRERTVEKKSPDHRLRINNSRCLVAGDIVDDSSETRPRLTTNYHALSCTIINYYNDSDFEHAQNFHDR